MEDIKPLIEASLFVAGRTFSIEELAEICKSGRIHCKIRYRDLCNSNEGVD